MSAFYLRRRTVLAGAAVLLAGPARADPLGPVAVFGDSQAEGVMAGLRRLSRRQPEVGLTIVNHTKPGTAISQPTYDWPAAIADYVAPAHEAARSPMAVCMFGGNDRLPIRPAGAPTIPFRSAPWEAIYRERVEGMMTALMKAGIRVTWLGQPVCKEPRYSGDMAWLNTIYEESAAKVTVADPAAPPVRFLPLWTVVSDGKGGFAPYGPGLDGKQQRMRHDDGIHFSVAGYDVVTRFVVAALSA